MPLDERPACALCLRRAEEPKVQFGTRNFCPTCVAAIGRFALEAPTRGQLWPALDHRAARPVDLLPLEKLISDEMTQLKSEGPGVSTVPEEFARDLSGGTVEENFAAFKNGLDQLLRPADVVTRVYLAIAYREMGLTADALEEAAKTLQHQEKLPPMRATLALGILLDVKSMSTGLDEALAVLRESLFAN